ncbi:MAG: translocation/assembly module TamB domain-containing protein, partial [Gemmatimonadota bacterium]|nr:translocation/assembly module TamB domain-containing protein [Gemmatimonadota bacterium]
MEGEITDLTPLRGLLGTETLALARGDIALELEGALDSLTADLAVEVGALAYGGVRFQAVELASEVTYVPASEATRPDLFGSADLSLRRILLEDAEVRDIAVRAVGGLDSFRVTATAEVDELRRGELVLAVDPRPERRTVLVENLELQLDRDRWRLVSPSLIRYTDGVLVDSFAVAAGTQRIVVDGGVDGAGSLHLDARVDSTDIGTVSDLVGLPDLQGWLAAEARLRGSTTDPEGSLRVEAGLREEDSAAGTADLTVRSDGRTFTAEGRLTHPAGGPLTLEGTGPARALGIGRADTTGFASGGPEFGLTLGAADFPVAWFDPLVDDATLTDLRGTLSADLRVSGTAADPLLAGPIELRSGGAEVPALGLEWDPIQIEAHGDGSRLVIDRAALGTGAGEARATGAVGWAELSRAPLDLEVVLDDFRAIHTFAYQARVSGGIDVGGRLDRPSIEGRIEVRSLDIYLDERVADEGLEDVTLTEEDLAMLRERFGYIPDDSVRPPLGERLSGNLRVVLGRDSWLRNREGPEMAVAFTGELDVRLRPGEPTLAEGTIEIIPRRGFVEQFGRRFELGDGTVVLDGPPESARLDLVATYTIPSRANPDAAEVTIILGIEGTRDELELTLSSEPPMDNADIVSYIATGRPAS